MAAYDYADEILWLLRAAPEGMTRAAIGRRMRHRPPHLVDAALVLLRERGLARMDWAAPSARRLLPDTVARHPEWQPPRPLGLSIL